MKNINNKIITNTLIAVFAMMLVFGCEKEDDGVSAVLSGGGEVLAGDSTELVVDFKGTPPFAFRYSSVDIQGNINTKNILGIEDYQYIFKVAPADTTTYVAESSAVKYANVGSVEGSATVNVIPVDYIYDQTFVCTNSGYVYQNDGKFYGQDTKVQLDFRSNSGGYDRIVYFEFDTKDITNVEEKNKYTLKFEIVTNHWQVGFGKGPELAEVKGMVGELDPAMTWGTQPGEDDLTALFNYPFVTESRYDLKTFEGDISSLVRSAINSNRSSKIVIRVKENINGIGSGAYHFIASGSHEDVAKRPSIDVKLRRIRE